MTHQPAPSLIDAFAPAYRVERELGRGATAKVYLAQDVRHQRRVAIKVLREEIAESIGTERFLQEARAVAALTHSAFATAVCATCVLFLDMCADAWADRP